MEERLRDDIVNEVQAFDGRSVANQRHNRFDDHLHGPNRRLLLHTETPDGSVIPVWEEVVGENVMVLKDVMADRKHLPDRVELAYARIPITSERPPDFTDLSELIEVMIRSKTTSAPIVINCQLGRGRSTLTSVRTESEHDGAAHTLKVIVVLYRSFWYLSSNGSQALRVCGVLRDLDPYSGR